ncbi:MAG: hypothetical protein FJ207_10645 [Gemmatimonadetes bacterium]|nr:hypothetical protein [Gemmatimonadota bacterium]
MVREGCGRSSWLVERRGSSCTPASWRSITTRAESGSASEPSCLPIWRRSRRGPEPETPLEAGLFPGLALADTYVSPSSQPPLSVWESPDRASVSDLDPKLTFDSFVVGPANRLASAAARRAAESPGTS